MMGVICNMVLEFADVVKGKGTKKAVLEKIGRSDEYDNGKIYEEPDFQKLLLATVEACGVDAHTAEVEFGKFAGKVVSDKFSGYFDNSKNARDLLSKVPAIHMQYPILAAGGEAVEVYPSAKISILSDSDNELVFSYRSPNKLCTFLKSLATWVSTEHYKENVQIEETQCIKNGAEFCRIAIKWS